MRNPFVGLRPFQSSDSDVFFGRDRDIAILGDLVRTLPVLVVFAPSGTGKSSIINAGLNPLLVTEPEFVVVISSDPAEDVLARASEELVRRGWNPPIEADARNFAALVQDHFRATDRRTIVVMDQFEERLNKQPQVNLLFAQIARLANSSSDAATIVLSLREDYLGDLEPLMQRVPGLLDASYRIPPLSRSQLEDAVYGPLRVIGKGMSAETALVREVLDDLEQQPRHAESVDGSLEAGYFQIVWSRLWSEEVAQSSDKLRLSTYHRLGGAAAILESFVTDTLTELLPVEAETLVSMIRYLILPTGAKVALTIDDLVGLIRRNDLTAVGEYLYGGERVGPRDQLNPDDVRANVSSVLNRLTRTSSPLFRRVIRGDREEFELIHDLLGKTLLSWRVEHERNPFPSSFDIERLELLRSTDKDDLLAQRPKSVAVLDHWTRNLKRMPDLLPAAAGPSEPDQSRGLDPSFPWAELEALRAATPDILASWSVLSKTGPASSLSKFLQECRRVLPGAEYWMTRHPSRTDRQWLQELAIAFRFMGPDRFWRGRSMVNLGRATVGVILALGAAYVGAFIADFSLRGLLQDMNVQYRQLTLAFPAFVAALFYVVFGSYDHSESSSGLRVQVRRAVAALFPMPPPRWSIGSALKPSPEDGTRRRVPQVVIRTVASAAIVIPVWWPLHFFLLEGGGYLGALIFQSADWAPTAGFNVGVLISSLVVAFWYLVAQDEI